MYPVKVKQGLIQELGQEVQQASQSLNCFIITDGNVAEHYLSQVHESFSRCELEYDRYILMPGEQSKNYENVMTIHKWLLENGADRSSVIIALGGGMICDLAGFVASTYMRGMKLVNVPTSLLAQIDAGIGSKTGINFGGVKNLIGSFYDPLAVLVDPGTLKTLPQQEIINGRGELFKYALLVGDKLLSLSLGQTISTDIIETCINYKMQVVAEDRTESSKRMLLNLGHTIGHGLEAVLSTLSPISHGQAVALGCIAEAHLAVSLGQADNALPARIGNLCAKLGLLTTVRLSRQQFDQVLETIWLDKKRRNGKLTWALPRSFGDVILTSDVSAKLVAGALAQVAHSF